MFHAPLIPPINALTTTHPGTITIYRRPVGPTPPMTAWEPGREPLYLTLVPGCHGRASGRGPAGPLHQPAMQAPGREGVRGHAPLPDPKGRVLHHFLHQPDMQEPMQKGRAHGHRPGASEAAPGGPIRGVARRAGVNYPSAARAGAAGPSRASDDLIIERPYVSVCQTRHA